MLENAFIIRGGTPLKGTLKLLGAKNIALKVLVASLLYDTSIEFRNIPQLSDIKELVHLLKATGADVKVDGNDFFIDPSTMNSHEVDLLHGSKIRVSFMLFAPFLHKFGEARIPNPGGCRIGARPIDRMVSLMEAFGVATEYDNETGYYYAKVVGDRLKGADYTFVKKTHTGTELAIMFAAVAEGSSVIKNASLEPEIDDLINLLNVSGADIKRIGDEIHVHGTAQLTSPTEPYTIACDRNNAVTYAVLAIATKGDIFIEGADENLLKVFLSYLDKAQGGYEVKENGIRFFYKGDLQATDIMTEPEPGFMTDWQAPWAVLMTQAHGTSTIHETVFENRFGYAAELNKLGAHIEFYKPAVENPHELYQFDIKDEEAFKDAHQGIKIHGPSQLHSGVMKVTDMRAGATLIIGALAATGESFVVGASEVDRGYQDIDGRLATLGAHIKRV